MRLLATTALSLALLTGSLNAQPAPASPEEYTLTVPRGDLDHIGNGLNELPAKIANPILQRLIAQINAQNEAFRKAREPAKAEEAVPLPTPRP